MKKKYMITGLFMLTALGLTSCSSKSKLNEVNTMMLAMTEVKSKTSDVAILDSIMAGYYLTLDSSFKNDLMIVENLTLAEESYGIGFRKNDVKLTQTVNSALYTLYTNGTMTEIATTYGLVDDIYEITNTNVTATDDSLSSVLTKGKLVIGYTLFAPIAYEEDSTNTLKGYDIDLAKAVCNILGVTAEFREINWDKKEIELSSGNIDCIWNGMTITDERAEAMSLSVPYLKNKQVCVINVCNKDKYKTLDSMKNAIFAAESGSAGVDCYNELWK